MANRLLRTAVLLLYVLSVVAPLIAQPADKPNADEQLRKGDQFVMEGKLGPARQAYERALAAGADLANDPTRARNLGLLYLNGTPHDFAKAARWLELAQKLRPADDTRLLLAQSLAWSGKYDAAISHYRALTDKSPDIGEYVTGLANTLYWAGKSDEAFAAYQRYLERKPSDFNIRIEYARLLSYGRKLPEANMQYRSVLQADPENVQAQIGVAKIASWQNDFNTALEGYNKVLKRRPGLYDAIVGKAYTLYWMGKTEEAKALFEQALKRNPNDKEVRATMKEMGVGETTEAKKETKPPKQQPKAEVAQAQPTETKPPEQAQVLQPDTYNSFQKPEARDAIVILMEQAQAAANGNNYVEAIHLYHQVLEKQPRNTQAMLQIARVLSWSRNFEDSAKQYDEVLQLEPDNMEARLERARVLSWGQNYDASIEEYNKLLKDAQAAQALAPKPAPKPVETVQTQPVEQPKPVETVQTQPVEQPKPVETVQTQPVEQPKPVETVQTQPVEQPKPVETAQAQPVERPAPEVEPEAPPVQGIDLVETRLELARVLAWAKRYDESLAQFNQILPPEQKAEAKDKPVLVEKARVLSWARQYEEAVKTYDVALALDPSDIEARMGKGQTLYWWGRLDQAAAVLKPLMQVQALSPEDKGTTAFTLAAVEHGRGKNARALAFLDATAPDNKDAKDLRRSIKDEMRPVWRSTFGWEDDREIDPAPSPASTLRVLRYTNSVAFNVHPDVRMTIANVVSESDTSNGLLAKYGSDVLSYELEALVDWRANSWLEVIAGAGEGGTGAGSSCDLQVVPLPCPTLDGPRTHQFVYDFHPILTHAGWRVDFTASRHLTDYTPLAITNNGTRHRWELDVSYNWRNRVVYGAEFWRALYDVESPQLTPALLLNDYSTSATGGALYFTPTWYRGEHITIDGGVRWEIYDFNRSAVPMIQALGSGGFFAPQEYERFSGNGRIVYTQGRLRVDVHGTFGPQRVTGFRIFAPPPPEWGTTGSFGTEVSVNWGRFHPFIAYDWFDTATAGLPGQTAGSYLSHSIVTGFTYRF